MAFVPTPLFPPRSCCFHSVLVTKPRRYRKTVRVSSRRCLRACSSEPRPAKVDAAHASDDPSAREARVKLWREVESLKKGLEIAVNAERFSDAARLRDEISSLSLADEYVRTEKELEYAVREERFADAAKLRDTLSELEPPPRMATLRGETHAEGVRRKRPLAEMEAGEVESWSKTKTNGIVVHVESYYMPEQSIPEQNRFLFGYKVCIANEGNDTCQLISRRWSISGGDGPESEVKGPGVVGRQPVLEPGEKFEYTSACPITVPLEPGQCVVGSMKGKYRFCKGDTGSVLFSVDINPFFFKLPFRNYRPPGSPSRGIP